MSDMTEGSQPIDFERLRKQVGSRVIYKSVKCKLVEVLEDDATVVLEACHQFSELQSGRAGDSMRHVPKIITIPIYIGSARRLNPAFIDLGLEL
ncbi:MAG: hypothetical protein GC138_05710 [Gammaproteobacteria bacterium]|nr:hypothetical protein [Gammaproteobacteria bacterium]